MVAVFALTAQAHAESLTRGPYLQNASTSAVSIRWRSNTSADSIVRYGTSSGALTQSVSSSSQVTEHELRITGLTPNTKYYYSIGSSANTLASGNDYFFVTSPDSSTPTRVWVIGDAGSGTSVQTGVRDAYYNYTGSRGTDLWLMLGDNAYNDGTDAEYQSKVFNIYSSLLRNSPVWSTLGNHDGHSASSGSLSGPYYDAFTFPRNAEAGGVASGTEAYYSFNYGNIHFVCLNSYDVNRSTGGAMLSWLAADLANNQQDWLVAFFHHPPYSKGSHNSDTETELVQMRQNALPILEDYGVDIVLSGHSHAYERTYLLDGHYGNSGSLSASMKVDDGDGRETGDGAYVKSTLGPTPNEGAVYVVAGASGKTSGGSLNHPAMYVSLNVAGSMVLDIDGDRLDATYLDQAGTSRDSFTMLKGVSGNLAPTVSMTTPTSGTSYVDPATISIAASASDSDGSIASVAFYGDGNLLGTDISAPYTWTWTSATIGSHQLTAVATDNLGATKTSQSVGISVSSSSGGPTTVELQNGLNGYAGMTDSTLRSDNKTTNYGNGTTLLADGKPDYSSVMRWDLSSIPAGKTITSVVLSVYVEDPSSSSYEFYALKRAFAESSATWNRAASGSNWQVAGATGSNDKESTVLAAITGSSTGAATVTFNSAGISKVQQWVDNSSSNYGLILLDYGPSNGLDLSSSESSTQSRRPKLVVTYQ